MDIRGIPESIFLSCQFELEIAGKEGNWFDGWMDGCFVSGCLPFVKLSYACRTLAQKKTQVQLQYISWNFNYQLRLEADSEALRKILSNNTRQTNKYKYTKGQIFIKNVTVFKIWFCLCLNNINYFI